MRRESHIYLDRTPEFPSIRFAFKCGFMGNTSYTVTDETGTFEAELRHTLGAYERSILNPHACPEDVVSYPDQVASEIGILRRSVCDNAGQLRPATVAAFNHWRSTEHARAVAFMLDNPERYGDVSDMVPPPPVTAGRWTRGHGWSAVAPVALERAA